MAGQNGRQVAKEREKDRSMQMHGANLSQKAQGIHKGVLEEIVDTDLSEGSQNQLRNLLTRDFVLANLSREEVHEFKWKLEAKKELFFAMHPPRGSLITGRTRAFINDDPHDRLSPLSDTQKMQVRDVFDGVFMRVTRSADMKQQEMLNTQISQVNKEDQSGSKGGLRGLLNK